MRTIMTLAIVLGCAPQCLALSFEELLASYDVLQTVAGTANITGRAVNGWLPEMEGGSALEAELSRPHITMADVQGNLYIADKDAHAVRLVTPDGTIHTIAGTSVAGFNGDGLGPETQLDQPNGLYTFPDGTTYILDLGNSMIRKLSTAGQLTTVLTDPLGILAGRGLWVSPDESVIYYSSGDKVRKWTAETGLSTYATGFAELGNLTVDPADNQVVATDRSGHSVYKLFDDGSKQRIAGNGTTFGGGSGQAALLTGLNEVRGVFYHPEGGYLLATHDGGQVWFVDEDDIIHLLVDGDNQGTHAGDGLPLDSPGKKLSEPRAVTLSPAGDLIITEHDGGFVRLARSLLVAGDFNHNGVLDVEDIDLLSHEVRLGLHDPRFDLNHDARVDLLDRELWVEGLKRTYFGDANLDGEFTSGDFVQVFQRGEYEDAVPANSTWASGDWDGNADFTSSDFVIAFQFGGYEKGPRESTRAVPEPTASLLVWFGWLLLSPRRRQLGRRRSTVL